MSIISCGCGKTAEASPNKQFCEECYADVNEMKEIIRRYISNKPTEATPIAQ